MFEVEVTKKGRLFSEDQTDLVDSSVFSVYSKDFSINQMLILSVLDAGT